MKVVAPTPLAAAAADALGAVSRDVVVIGATAVEIALAPYDVAITPTRDVDVFVPVEGAELVIGVLEAGGLRPSDEAHERGFTWVEGDLKVQLVRKLHRFPPPAAAPLAANSAFGMASPVAHRHEVAFAADPERPRLWVANVACLVALKEAAFGRTRYGDEAVAERDYHDVHLLATHATDELAEDFARAEYEVRARTTRALETLRAGEDATAAAGRQCVLAGETETQRQGEAAVRRAAARALRRLAR